MPKKPRKPRKTYHKPPPKLRGFKVSGQEDARERIDRALTEAQADLKSRGIDARRYLHVNRDGSIDAELYLPVPRGRKAQDMYLDIQEATPKQMTGGIWLSAGARFAATHDEDNYHRFKGLQQVQTHFRRYTWQAKPNVLATMSVPPSPRQRGGIVALAEKSQRRKMDSIFVRLHWNAEGRKPYRKEPKGKKRK